MDRQNQEGGDHHKGEQVHWSVQGQDGEPDPAGRLDLLRGGSDPVLGCPGTTWALVRPYGQPQKLQTALMSIRCADTGSSSSELRLSRVRTAQRSAHICLSVLALSNWNLGRNYQPGRCHDHACSQQPAANAVGHACRHLGDEPDQGGQRRAEQRPAQRLSGNEGCPSPVSTRTTYSSVFAQAGLPWLLAHWYTGGSRKRSFRIIFNWHSKRS